MAMPPPGAECVDYAAYAQYRVYAAAPAAAGCAPEQSYVQPYYATPYEFVQPQW
jgi:hypothetical protein